MCSDSQGYYQGDDGEPLPEYYKEIREHVQRRVDGVLTAGFTKVVRIYRVGPDKMSAYTETVHTDLFLRDAENLEAFLTVLHNKQLLRFIKRVGL